MSPRALSAPPPTIPDPRLDEFVEVLIGLAKLDFSHRASITGTGDALDAVAVGLNMLGEELQESVVSRSELLAANKRLHRANQGFAATLRAIPDVLFELDEAGTYRKIWARDPALLAAQEELLLGRTAADVAQRCR